jgi:hypothetical protein
MNTIKEVGIAKKTQVAKSSKSIRRPRPITITFTGDIAGKIRKQAKELGMSPSETAWAFARLGLILCDTNDVGVELRDSLRSQEPVIDSIFGMAAEVTGNIYALPGCHGLP